ncbi:unnamed protein product [Victoria cruziana]
MKGGKEEAEKLMGPLFPRLHVNDSADKGGPRAPPRNKMALYEQLSIPSQRYGSAAGSVPVPRHNNGALFSPPPSSQGCGHDRTLFTSFYVQQAPSYPTDKVNLRSSDGASGDTTSVSIEPKPVKNMSKASSIAGRSSSTMEHTPFRRHDASNKRDLGGRRVRDEDDFRVPTLADSGNAGIVTKDKMDLTLPSAYSGDCTATASSSPPKHKARGCNFTTEMRKPEDQTGKWSNNLSKKLISSGDTVGYPNCPAEEKQDGSGHTLDSFDKITPTPDAELILSEQPRYVKSSLNRDCLHGPSNDVGDVSTEPGSCSDSGNEQPLGGSGCSKKVSTVFRSKADAGMAERGGYLKIRNERTSSESPANSDESPIEKKTSGKMQPNDRDKNDDASETSMVDIASALEISPDDIVGVIGPKQFWKARRAMLNQQRLFSVQVFELHRLIKVQKLFAGSPHLLLDDELYLTIPPKKAANSKIVSDLSSKPQPPIVKHKEVPPVLSQTAAVSPAGKPDSSVDEGILKKDLTNQASNNGRCNDHPQDSAAADSKNTAWCFPPMGTQWLVPVMSPSEGLIYKPISGPCPPAGGLMPPVYSACNPLGIPVMSDFNNPTYVLPPSQQGGIAILPSGAQGYFPPYGVHVNPVVSGSMSCEQASARPGNLLRGQTEQSAAEANMNMHSRGSCNISSRKGDAFSCHIVKIQACKDSEFQGSTASTPSIRCEKMEAAGQASEGRDSVQFLPQTPVAVENLDTRGPAESSEHHSRVIKVVPHNPLSATESAARIFRSIQKERQLYDSF